jgi:hypothetical protein
MLEGRCGRWLCDAMASEMSIQIHCSILRRPYGVFFEVSPGVSCQRVIVRRSLHCSVFHCCQLIKDVVSLSLARYESSCLLALYYLIVFASWLDRIVQFGAVPLQMIDGQLLAAISKKVSRGQ